MANRFAFATLVTSDHYLPGALAVAAALKDVHPRPPTPPEVEFQTVCIVTPETVDVKSIKALRKAFDVVIGVEVIDVQNEAGLALLGERFASSLCSLNSRCFRVTCPSASPHVIPGRYITSAFRVRTRPGDVTQAPWPFMAAFRARCTP